jgi:stage II sporulation protein Q
MREEEKKQSSQGVKRFLKKRWAYPAIYIASAALILTGVLWFQNSSTDQAIDSEKFNYNASDVPGNDFGEPSVEVNRSLENVVLPLSKLNSEKSVIQTKFYDDNLKTEEQEAALVVYQNQYHPNTGIDLTVKDSEAFEVVAALSGTVTRVQDDALLGNVIEIDHEDGIVTQYQSVKDIQVKVGDSIKQGQTLATAGNSLIN